MAAKHDIVDMPTLGRQFQLGMLYDSRSDQLIEGSTLWHPALLRDISEQQSFQHIPDYEVITEDSLDKKFSVLKVLTGLKLSLLSGLVTVSGSAEYLNDYKTSLRQSRVTIHYRSNTRQVSVKDPAPHNTKDPGVTATHVVTGISYGIEAFLIFDVAAPSTEEEVEVRSNLQAEVKRLVSYANGQGLADFATGEKISSDSMKITFYGDLALESKPATFQDAARICQRLLQGKDEKNAVPKFVQLSQLSEFGSRVQPIVRGIKSDLVTQTAQIMDSVLHSKCAANDLTKLPICSKFPLMRNEIRDCIEIMNDYEGQFRRKIAKILPGIKGEGNEETEISNILSSHERSPFDNRVLDPWLSKKSKALHLLETYLKKFNTIKFCVNQEDLYDVVDDIDKQYVVCLYFCVNTMKDPHVSSLRDFLKTSRPVAPETKVWWYDDSSATKKLRANVTKFFDSYKENQLNPKVTFLVAETAEEAEPNSVSQLVLFTDGVHQHQVIAPSVKIADLVAVMDQTSKPQDGTAAHDLRSMDLHSRSSNTSHLPSSGDSEPSTSTILKPIQRKRYIDELVKDNKLYQQGQPMIYEVLMEQTFCDQKNKIRKYQIGKPAQVTRDQQKVILVVGETGSGKSTLINGIMNYMFNVQWSDNVRFKVIIEDGEESEQACSMTKWITAYTVYKELDSPSPYSLTLIDTPGFGDTGGMSRDKEIKNQLHKFFSDKGLAGIDQIDAVGIVVQSPQARLTPTQTYVFDCITSVFGSDIKDNIFLLVTYGDSGNPAVLSAVKAAELPFTGYCKFNNGALYSSNTSSDRFEELYWRINIDGMKLFFSKLSNVKPQSLVLTREVLSERGRLETVANGILPQLQAYLTRMDEIAQLEKAVHEHEPEIQANRNFEKEVVTTTMKKVPINPEESVTNCDVCNFTCHYPCGFNDPKDKVECDAMRDGNCIVCPGRCHWKKHSHGKFRFETVLEQRKETLVGLKKRYHFASEQKVQKNELVSRMEDEFKEAKDVVYVMIQRMQESIARLDEIALRPNNLSASEYIDILIESERSNAKPGYKERIRHLQEAKSTSTEPGEASQKPPKDKNKKPWKISIPWFH